MVRLQVQLWTILILICTTGSAGFAASPVPQLEKILVSNFNNSKVLQFSPTGTLLGVFGQADSSTGISTAGSLIVDQQGRVYVSSISTGKVLRYTRNGQFLGTFATTPGGFFRGLDFDSGGGLYLRQGAVSSNNILRFDSSGNLASNFITFVEGQGDIAIDGSGVLYVPLDQPFSATNDGIVRMTTTGTSLGVFGQANNAQSGVNSPESAAFDANGNLYVASAGNVLRYNAAGTYLGVFATGVAKNLEFDAAGNLYGTDGSEEAVLKYDSNGNFVGKLLTAGSGGLPANFLPEGITFIYQVPEPSCAALAAMAGGLVAIFWLLDRRCQDRAPSRVPS